jgi:NAD(P)-dependent dehydrogenase (short-subunit alcohol dehydrogenase family)
MGTDLFRLDGKTAVVTGGGSGLGRAICLGLADAGCQVIVTDVLLDKAVETSALIRSSTGKSDAIGMDVGNKGDIQRAVAQVLSRWKNIDVLVNNAGRAIRGSALDYQEEDWDAIINVNLKGVFLCSQVVGRHMAERRSGKIINIASIGGFIAYPGSIAYLASKGGVVQLTRGFAVELAQYNVQVNGIAPSLFETPLVAKARSDSASLKYFMDRTPAGRKGHPEEVAGAAIFLASECSGMVTGHTIAVDGGFLSA